MKLSAKLHVPASLLAGRETPTSIVQEAGRVPERVCTLWRRESSPDPDLSSTFKSREQSFPTGFSTTILQVSTIFNMRATNTDYLILHYFKTLTVFSLDEVTGEWRKLHNEKLNDLYSLLNIVRVVKSRRMR